MQKTDVLIEALVSAIKDIGQHISKTDFFRNHRNLCIYLSTFRKVLYPYIIKAENGYICVDDSDFRKIRELITDYIYQHILDITDNLSQDFIIALGAERYEKSEANAFFVEDRELLSRKGKQGYNRIR